MEIINTRKKNWLYNLEPKAQNMRQIELEKGMKTKKSTRKDREQDQKIQDQKIQDQKIN